MERDYIKETMPWLDGVFARGDTNPSLFSSKKHREIAEKLKTGWGKKNRLDLLRSLEKEYGKEDVLTVLDAVHKNRTAADWKEVDKKEGGSFETLYRMLWSTLKPPEFHFSEEFTDTVKQFKVTHCFLAETARKIKAEEWFFHLACLSDYYTIEGLNSDITFKRSKTLMQGDDSCDHCYLLPES